MRRSEATGIVNMVLELEHLEVRAAAARPCSASPAPPPPVPWHSLPEVVAPTLLGARTSMLAPESARKHCVVSI
jgi:hypothetical protein